MSYIHETENYRGYEIKIVADEYPENPREFFEPAATMVCWHSRYNLGDLEIVNKRERPISNNYQEPIDLLYELAGVDRSEYQDKEYELSGEYNDMSHDELFHIIETRGTIISSLYLYDHSGITISMSSFSCVWDSGCVGFVYMTKETIEKEGWTSEQAMKYMEGEVETYDNYLTGEVYGWVVEDADGDEIDRCSGYYGDGGVKDAIAEARSTIDYQCKKRQEEYEKLPKKKSAEMYML